MYQYLFIYVYKEIFHSAYKPLFCFKPHFKRVVLILIWYRMKLGLWVVPYYGLTETVAYGEDFLDISDLHLLPVSFLKTCVWKSPAKDMFIEHNMDTHTL